MSYNLKGITLQISADSTGLQKEIAKIKSQVKGIDTIMSNLKKSMKFNANDFASVSSYQKLLSDKIQNTTKQLKAYNTAIKNFPKTETEWKNSVSKLNSQLSTYSTSLKNTRSEITNLTKTQKENVSSLKNTISSQKASLESLSNQYKSNQQQIIAWQQAANNRTRSVSEASKAITSLESQQNRLINAIPKTTAALDANQKTLASYANGTDATSQKIATLKNKEEELTSTVNKLNSKVAGLGSTFEESQQKLATMSAISATTKNELLELERGFISTSDSVIKFYTSMGKISTVTDKLAGLTKGLSMLSGATIVGATAAAVSFESAWTGVTKTVNGTPAQLEKVNNGLKELATQTSSSYQTIANYAEIAGQMGVGADNVVAFTKTITMLGDTTNLVGEEAAQAIAKFKNIMQGTGEVAKEAASNTNEYYEKVGSTIVDLGNKFATTESDITEMSNRLAVAAHQVNINEQGVLGLSTALSSLGIKAEAGGSAISTVLKNIETQVKTGGEYLEEYAKVAGMSAEEFSNAWENDALGTFQKVCAGIGNSADGVTVQLSKLGITNIRQSQAMGALAQSSNVLNQAIDTSNSAWASNTAMVNEAEKRYSTLKSQLSQTWEAIKQAGNELGQSLAPTLGDSLGVVKNLALGFTNLSDGTKEGIAKMLLFTTALSPMLKITSKVTGGLKDMTDVFGTISAKSARWSNSLLTMAENAESAAGHTTALSTATLGAATGMSKFSKIMSTAAPVLTGVMIGVTALAAGLTYVKEAQEKYVANLDKQMSKEDAVYKSILKDIEAFAAYKESYNNLSKEIESYGTSVENNEAKANSLLQTIEQLNGVENKSETQKQMLKQAVEDLNGIYPDLKYSVDETSGALLDQNGTVVTNIDSLKEYCKKLQETAEIQAYTQQYLKEKEAIVETQVQIKKLTNAQEELTKKREKYVKIMSENSYDSKEYQEALGKFTQVIDKLETVNGKLKKANNNLKESKENLKIIASSMSEVFGDDLKNSLTAMQESATQAGINIPKKLAKAIKDGKGNVQEATDYLNAYNNYQGMINAASEAGTQIPSSIANGVLNNITGYQEKINALNNMANFQQAVTNAGLSGEQITQKLAQKVAEGKITVDEAMNYINGAANFQSMVDNAGIAGDLTVQKLVEKINNGSLTFDEACKKLAQDHGLASKISEDTLRAAGFTEDQIKTVIGIMNESTGDFEQSGKGQGDAHKKGMESADVPGKAKEITNATAKELNSQQALADAGSAGTNLAEAFKNPFASVVQTIKGWISDLFGQAEYANSKFRSKNSNNKGRSFSLDRISELPSGMSALYAIPEIRGNLPFETRDVNATNALSARRLAMFNAATNAISEADLTMPSLSYGSSSRSINTNAISTSVLKAISTRLNSLEEEINRIATPIDATVSFVGTLNGNAVTDEVTKNINREINNFNRGRGGRR